jgi:hypothetical protein
MKYEVASLKTMEKYRKELRTQIENLIVGKPITKSLSDMAPQSLSSLNNIAKEIKLTVTAALSAKEISDGEVSSVIHDCERALKLNQAIKMCNGDGVSYWMWRLQPGEKAADKLDMI